MNYFVIKIDSKTNSYLEKQNNMRLQNNEGRERVMERERERWRGRERGSRS